MRLWLILCLILSNKKEGVAAPPPPPPNPTPMQMIYNISLGGDVHVSLANEDINC